MIQSGVLDSATPRWLLPFLQPKRYKGAKGGRSGGKSHGLIEKAVIKMAENPDFKVVCIREIQKSIRFSVKSLMEAKIRSLGLVHLFEIQDKVIKHRHGDGIAIFEGMQDHTADSVKGLEAFDLAIVDEANQLSARSLKLLTPTLRKEGSELWFAWNPENDTDAVDEFFSENDGHPDFLCVHVNITDNPFISQTGWNEYVRAKQLAHKKHKAGDLNALDTFNHVWLGHYDTRSDKFVFHNWKTGELNPPENVVWFYGADWGFSQDPTAGVRFCVINETTLYIRNEVYEVGTPTESLPTLFKGLPNAPKWPMRADSARPETIDYMRRHGYPRIVRAKKGKGSVEDGVTFLQGMDIVIHPDCANTAREFKLYAYKVDKASGEILPVIEDKNNHAIDAVRYGSEGLHRKGKLIKTEIERSRPKGYDYGIDDEDEAEASWKVA